MEQSNQNKMHVLKEKFVMIKDFIMDHRKIVMPVVLVVCVLITILVAVNANQKETLQREAEEAAAAAAAAAEQESSAVVDGIVTPVYELEENAYEEINQLVQTYYDAQASGDVATISSLNTYLDDIELIRVEEMSKYIESYTDLNVYTKPGLSENTYVAYVYSEVKFTDAEEALPGLKTYYIGQDEEGQYFINDGSYDETVTNYIKEVTLQDDVVDLNNKVVVEYNDLLAENDELNEYVAYLKEKINEDVGEILADAEASETETEVTEAADATELADADTSDESEEVSTATVSVTTKVKTTDVVNIRSSDSETADKIDKAQKGQEFTLLEQRGNGWSKIEYNGSEAYIKSDYLETIEEVTTDNGTDAADTDTSNDTVSGTVTVTENVKVRKSASTDSDSLGTVYVGEKLDLIMKQSDGWTKVKYKGETAYVKSDYVK